MFLFVRSGVTLELFPLLEVETTFQNNQLIYENVTCRNEILISFDSVVRHKTQSPKCEINYNNL